METSIHPESPLNSPSASGHFRIPAISLSGSREQTIDALRNAALASGFFQLVDLGSHISPALIVQMFEETRLFFQLPKSEKQKVTKKSHLVGGYEGFRFYNLAKTGDAGKKGEDDEDGGWNEGFAVAPEWGINCFPKGPVDSDGASPPLGPFDPDAFELTCKAYFHAIQELGRHVLGMIAEGLGLQQDFFEGYLENQNSFCRLTHYYREEADGDGKAGEVKENHNPDKVEIGAAPHTDWGALTLLVQDLVGGLQVYDRQLNHGTMYKALSDLSSIPNDL